MLKWCRQLPPPVLVRRLPSVPLTHRGSAEAVVFASPQARAPKGAPKINWRGACPFEPRPSPFTWKWRRRPGLRPDPHPRLVSTPDTGRCGRKCQPVQVTSAVHRHHAPDLPKLAGSEHAPSGPAVIFYRRLPRHCRGEHPHRVARSCSCEMTRKFEPQMITGN